MTEIQHVAVDVLPAHAALAVTSSDGRIAEVRAELRADDNETVLAAGPVRLYEIPEDGVLRLRWSDLWDVLPGPLVLVPPAEFIDPTPAELAAGLELLGFDRLAAALRDPERINRRAAYEAARTDPWRWYCRICGAEGQDAGRLVRNEQAEKHLSESRCGAHPRPGRAEVGHLLHVWTY